MDDLNWTKVLALELASILGVISGMWLFIKNKLEKVDIRFQRNEDKITELSEECSRRSEMHEVISPIRSDIKELRLENREILKMLTQLSSKLQR